MELIAHCTCCLPRKKTRSIQTDGGVVYREYSYNCASQACQIAFDNHDIRNCMGSMPMWIIINAL